MLVPVLLFIVGLLFLIKGGDWFVDGASALARRFHLPELLIGATVVSIGTTLPEVMVSTMSAVSGHGEIAYGNAIGSVICNSALIAAITIAVRPGKVDPKTLRVPVAFFFAAAAIYCVAAYAMGEFTRPLGFVMLAMFVAYMVANVLQMKKAPAAAEAEAEAESAGEEMSLAKTLVLLVLGFTLAAHPQNVFGAKWTEEELALGAKLLRIMSVNAALSFPVSVFESNVNINERYLFLKLVAMAKSVLSPMISIPLLLLGYHSPAIAILSLILTIVSGVVEAFYCLIRLRMPISFRGYDFALMKSMMGFTFYVFIAVVVDQVNYGIGTLMTTWIHGTELSAVYYNANQLNVYYLSFAMAISNVLAPRVHRMVASNTPTRELGRLMTRAGRLQFIMLMCVFLGFVAVGRPFVVLWAKGDASFAIDYPVAILLFLSTIMSSIQFVGLEILRAKGMHKFRAWVYLAAAGVNVVLMIPLCRKWGLLGVAGSILIVTLLGNVLPINWYYCKRIGLDVRRFWRRIAQLLPSMLLPAIVAVLIARFAQVGSYLQIALWGCVFVAVYAGSLWIFGMNRYERGLVSSMLGKIFRRGRR